MFRTHLDSYQKPRNFLAFGPSQTFEESTGASSDVLEASALNKMTGAKIALVFGLVCLAAYTSAQ